LVKVVVELVTVDEGGVWLFELVAVQVDEDSFEVVDELVNPGKMEKRPIDSLE
jgi:hypothetical protein